MARPSLRHRIERTRNKHSRAICRDNTIIIRLARGLSRTEEREHIQNLLRRMTHLVLEERSKTIIDPFRPLLNGQQSVTVTLATGKQTVFQLVPGDRTGSRRTRAGWRVTIGPGIRRKALHRYLWSLLADDETPRIAALVERINDRSYRARIRNVRLGFASTQWGSCSPHGDVMLNAALLFLPPRLLTYVIVHELAHTRQANHSAAYWREVARYLPQYEQAYNDMHDYRLPTL